MKMPNKCMLSVLLGFSCLTSFGQKADNRPAYFAAYPANINVQPETFNNALKAVPGTQYRLTFSPEFSFDGVVVANQQPQSEIHSVIIRRTDKTAFQVTRILDEKGAVVYTGRLLNPMSADGYEIKNNNGKYHLQKFQTSKILEPCNL